MSRSHPLPWSVLEPVWLPGQAYIVDANGREVVAASMDATLAWEIVNAVNEYGRDA